jgi:hypothetical protein
MIPSVRWDLTPAPQSAVQIPLAGAVTLKSVKEKIRFVLRRAGEINLRRKLLPVWRFYLEVYMRRTAGV